MTEAKASSAERKSPLPKKKKSHTTRYVEGMLRDGEELLRVADIHWAIYWKSIAVFILALILLALVPNLGYFLLLVAAVTATIAGLTRYYLMLAVTSKRVLARHGILQLDTIQIQHNRIESVEVERPLLGRILGYGTVLVSGTGSRVTAIPFIRDAEEFRSYVDSILYKED